MTSHATFNSLIVGLIICVSIIILLSPAAFAQDSSSSYPHPNPCNGNTSFGVVDCHGYFTNKGATCADFPNNSCYNPNGTNSKSDGCALNNGWCATNILAGGFPSTLDASVFKTTVENALDGSGSDSIGGAFIVDTMLGHQAFGSNSDASGGVTYAKNHISGWEALVDYYANAPAGGSYGVIWNAPTLCSLPNATGSQNSGYYSLITDDGFHPTDCNYDDTPQIEFYWDGGGSTYYIGQNCGNVEYNSSTPQQVPPITYGCGLWSVTPTAIDPYTKFSTSVAVTANGGTPPSGGTMNLQITNINNRQSPIYSSQTAVQTSTVGTETLLNATFNNIGPIATTGTYNLVWFVSWPGQPNEPDPNTCGSVNFTDKEFNVADLPYLNVYGGDVMVGNSPQQSQSSAASACVSNPHAGIYSWDNSGPTYSGAGSEYAVEALGQIQGFASSQNTSSPTPTSLSFANNNFPSNTGTWLDPSLSLYGGDLYGTSSGPTTGDCNFANDVKGVTQQDDTNGSNVNLPSTVTGTQVFYVKGDVFIGQDITYCGVGVACSWGSTGAIPYFKLIVVGGNIYVSNTVSQLDGLYVTEPDSSGVGGIIYTCATGRNPASASPSMSGYYDTCNHQLTINGSFIAKQVQFLRTSGTLGTPTPSPAEVFNYSPELWLPRGTSPPSSAYDSITGLPPVL